MLKVKVRGPNFLSSSLPSFVQNLNKKWETSWLLCWRCTISCRRLAGRQPWPSLPKEATQPSPSLSSSSTMPLQLQLHPRHQSLQHLLPGADVIVDVARRREPRQMPEPPSTRLLKPSVLHLLYQEMPPVLHWIAHSCLLLLLLASRSPQGVWWLSSGGGPTPGRPSTSLMGRQRRHHHHLLDLDYNPSHPSAMNTVISMNTATIVESANSCALTTLVVTANWLIMIKGLLSNVQYVIAE